jgi:uncharacterized membrane protein
VLERDAVLLVDVGVETLARSEAWRRAEAAVLDAVRRGDDGVEVARELAALEAVLAPALTRSAADVDELPNEVSET